MAEFIQCLHVVALVRPRLNRLNRLCRGQRELYSYGREDPINRLDVDGLQTIPESQVGQAINSILSNTSLETLRIVGRKTATQAACVVFESVSQDVMLNSIIYVMMTAAGDPLPGLPYVGKTVQQSYQRWRKHHRTFNQVLAIVEKGAGVSLANAEATVLGLIDDYAKIGPRSARGGLANKIRAPGIVLPYCKGKIL